MKKNLLKIAAVALTCATVVLGTSSAVFADTGTGTGTKTGTHAGSKAGSHGGKGTHTGTHGAGKHGGTTTTTVAG